MKAFTAAQTRVLKNLHLGREVDYGISGRSQYGGQTATLAALHRVGLITHEYTLTSEGARVAADLFETRR